MNYKNFLFKLLVKGYNLFVKPSSSHTPRKFLIVSTTGLGDTLWATPAIASLKKAFPGSSISVLTSSVGIQVLENNPNIDQFFLLKSASLFRLIPLYVRMKKERFTTALFFHTSQRVILPFCYFLGIPERIGTKGLQKGLDSLLSSATEKKKNHEIARRLEIVKALKIPAESKDLELFVQDADREKAKAWFKENKISDSLPIVILHPGAKDKFKQWSLDCFIRLGKCIQENHPCNLLITGSVQEKKLVTQIASALSGSIPLIQNLSVLTFAAILEKASLFIVGDTGPMHVSFALQKPTVALFSATDPALCGPYSASSQKHSKVIHKLPTCIPCIRKKCINPFCLLQISPEEVYKMALPFLLISDKK